MATRRYMEESPYVDVLCSLWWQFSIKHRHPRFRWTGSNFVACRLLPCHGLNVILPMGKWLGAAWPMASIARLGQGFGRSALIWASSVLLPCFSRDQMVTFGRIPDVVKWEEFLAYTWAYAIMSETNHLLTIWLGSGIIPLCTAPCQVDWFRNRPQNERQIPCAEGYRIFTL